MCCNQTEKGEFSIEGLELAELGMFHSLKSRHCFTQLQPQKQKNVAKAGRLNALMANFMHSGL